MLVNQFHIVASSPPIFECIQEMGIPSNIYAGRDDLVLGWVAPLDAMSFTLITTYQGGIPYYEVARYAWHSQRRYGYQDVPTFIEAALRKNLKLKRASEKELLVALTKFFKGDVRC